MRNVGGRRLSDAEMTAYYAGIAHRLGGRCMAEYRNAICLILDENRRYEHYGPDISGVRFYLVDKPVQQKEEGFRWIRFRWMWITESILHSLRDSRVFLRRVKGSCGFSGMRWEYRLET